MAVNTFAPSGFKEGRSLQGVAPNYAYVYRFINPTYATPIAQGDPVILVAAGTIQVMTSGLTTIDGIFMGCQFLNPSFPTIPPWQPAWPGVALAASTIVLAKVMVDPHMTFYAQANNATPFTLANIGQNIDILTGTSGVPQFGTGQSTCGLAAASATTATLPFRIVNIVGFNDLSGGVAINPSYNPALGNQWLEVAMNTQDFTQVTGI